MKAIALIFTFTLSFSAMAGAPLDITPHFPKSQPARVKRRDKLKDLQSLDAQATFAEIPSVPLYCEFWALGQPKSWSIYDPATKTVWMRTGYPRQTQVFSNVSVSIGQAPYGDTGFTLLAFGDVPLFSVLMKAPINCPFFAFLGQIFDPGLHATWAKFPGGPADIINAGYCGIGRPAPFEDDDFVGW